MANPDRVPRQVIDAHSHIGELPAWKFYDLPEPVKPTVYDFPDKDDYLQHMDSLGVERGLVLPNYGIPVQEHPFSLNDVMLDAVTSSDRLKGGLWVSFRPENREMTLDALRHAGEEGVVALKTTFLLGGTPDPGEWDEATEEVADACFEAAREHDLVFHFHTSPGGSSDLSRFIPLIERYGQQVKMHLVHFGGGVSGHIRLVPKFFDWIEQGYQLYTDTTWAVGFGARWLFTEMEQRGIGHDRVLFASDEPWSDFWSEYSKVAHAPIGEELKERILHGNYEELYGGGA